MADVAGTTVNHCCFLFRITETARADVDSVSGTR